FQRRPRSDLGGLHQDAPKRWLYLEFASERLVFQCLELQPRSEDRLAFKPAILDTLEENINLFIGYEEPDVLDLGILTAGEGQTDHLVSGQGWSAAVAWIEGSTHLNRQA